MLYGEGKYTYEVVEGWAKHPEGWEFRDVCHLAIDSQDRVYVLNRGAHPIQVYDPDGNLLAGWDEKIRGHGCSIGPDDCFYLAESHQHTVSKYSLDGKLLMTLGNKGQPSDTGYRTIGKHFESCRTVTRAGAPFNGPSDVAVSPSTGKIYVSDGAANCRVHKFSPEGKLLLSWGEPGYEEGQFRIPESVWVDKQERVYVCDRENDRVQIFDAQGRFLSQWLGLSRPTDIFIDDEDIVYVTEYNARLSIFNIAGELLARWGDGWVLMFGFENKEEEEAALWAVPHGVIVDSKGDMYVGDVGLSNIKSDRGPKTLLKFVRRS
ncbi:peptidyl-alpha-hydroxyglycine alpha-amidating lyase family protein [Chloroflexota bacterium]